MKLGTVGVNLANIEGYRTALKGLNVEQSVFALASKGATEEQIRQILITNEATAKDVEAAIAKAGLTTATKALTQAEMVEIAHKNGVAKAEAEELLRKIGIAATEEGQVAVKKQVTLAMLEQAVASGKITVAESAQIATMLGLNDVEIANIGITNVLTASFAKLWAVIAAHPIGAILTAIGVVAVGTIAYINKANKDAKKALKEASDEAKSAIDSIKSKFDTLASDTNKIKKRYAELAQGVENLGKANQSRGRLSTEDYEEFLDLSNQLAKLFPQLTINFDDNGNAILNLSGNVDTIVGSLENLVSVQQKLANQEIIKNMPGVWSDHILNLKKFNKELKDSENQVKRYLWLADCLRNNSAINIHDEYYNNLLVDAAISAGIMNSRYGNDFYKEKHMVADAGPSFLYASWDFSKLSEDSYDSLLEKLEELGCKYENIAQLTKTKIESSNSNLSSYINTWLSTEWNFNKLDSNLQNVAKSMLFDGGWVSLIPDTVDSDNWDEVSNWIQQELLFQLRKAQYNEEISSALSEVFSNAELTLEAKESYIKQIQDYFGEKSIITVLLQPQFKTTTDTAKALKKSIRQLTDDRGGTDREAYTYLMEEIDFDSFTQEQAELWLTATQGAENAKQAVEMYKAKLAELEKEHNPISFSDIFSLKDADNKLTPLGKISESIDTIQNAYKTLNDAIDEYNEEGAFSIDTLQSVIALGDDWLDYLVDAEGNLKLDKEALEDLTQARLNDMRIQAINNVIDNVSKIQDEAGANEYLASTNYALADSYESVAKARLSDARANMAKAVEAGDLSQSSMDAALNKATADIDKINTLFANTGIDAVSIFGGSGGSDSSSKSNFSETIDLFERRVEVLDGALSHLKSTMDNISGSSAKNNLVDAELGITGEKFKNYTDALSMYTQKANEALSKLPADIAAKVKDGAVAFNDFVGDGNKDVVEAIKDYESWADKVADCKQELAELKKEIRQLELEKFNNIMEDFQNQFNLRDDSKDLISKQIDLLKEAGDLIGESFFTAQIDQSKKQLALLETEKAQLVNQMSSAINSGRVDCCPLLQ